VVFSLVHDTSSRGDKQAQGQLSDSLRRRNEHQLTTDEIMTIFHGVIWTQSPQPANYSLELPIGVGWGDRQCVRYSGWLHIENKTTSAHGRYRRATKTRHITAARTSKKCIGGYTKKQ